MSIRLRLFSLSMPGFLRAACIRALARVTARGFGVECPRVRSLDDYAALTARWAAPAHAHSADRLFSSAEELGTRLRSWLGIRSHAEAMAAMRALYRLVDVDFRGSSESFTVARCRFSSCFSARECGLVSHLDAGVLSGLTAGKRMVFTQRITEGAPFCRGVLR